MENVDLNIPNADFFSILFAKRINQMKSMIPITQLIIAKIVLNSDIYVGKRVIIADDKKCKIKRKYVMYGAVNVLICVM